MTTPSLADGAEAVGRYATAFERDGLPFSHPDCRFYKDGHGKPAPYPNGMTAEQWANGPGRSSAMSAADLPED